jgi:hypothetical protein
MSDKEVKQGSELDLEEIPETKLTRRAALARLGLAATTAYVAPSIMHIDRSANAFVVPSPCSR